MTAGEGRGDGGEGEPDWGEPSVGFRAFGSRSPRFPRRFRTRVFLYIALLSVLTSVASAIVYYTRQDGFIKIDRARRARTLLSSLATQAELGAYAGDRSLCDVAARQTFREEDVVLVAIYDRRGTQILRFQAPQLSPPPPSQETIYRMTRSPDERLLSLKTTDRSGEKYDDLYAPIVTISRDVDETLAGGPSGRLSRYEVVGIARIGLSEKLAAAQLAEVTRWGFFLAIGLLAIGGAAALLISRRISQPIHALTLGADALSEGVLDTRVEVGSQDEIGALAYSFNRMATRLRESILALETLNRGLEAEVARRTAEIQRAAAFSSLLNAPLAQSVASTAHRSGPTLVSPPLPSGETEGGVATGNLGRLLDDALHALLEGTGASGGAALLTREEAVLFELEVARHRGAPAGAFGEPPTAERLKQAEGKPFIDPSGDANRLIVPLLLGDEPQGCLVLLGADAREDVQRFTAQAAAQLSIAVGNLRAYAAAAHLARALEERNAALAQQRDQLQQMNRLKSEFLASISHELRTPLNAIIGYAELISDGIYGGVTGDQVSALSGINESGRHLLQLISEILDLSKIEAGKMTVRLEEVDVVEIVQAVLAEAAPLARDRPYKPALLDGDRPLVRTDGEKLKQIVTNLVSNAIKFTPRGQVDVQIRETPGVGCTIAVRDTGIGIRPEDMQIIFEEFRQADGSYTREFGGTGLGLAIAKRFAELLGGQIAVESKVGAGSVFTLQLPLDTPEPRTSRRMAAVPPPMPAEARREGKSA